MLTLQEVAARKIETHEPGHVEFHSEAELRTLIDQARAEGVRSLICETSDDDQTVRRLADRAGVICARRVRDGRAKWIVFTAVLRA